MANNLSKTKYKYPYTTITLMADDLSEKILAKIDSLDWLVIGDSLAFLSVPVYSTIKHICEVDIEEYYP